MSLPHPCSGGLYQRSPGLTSSWRQLALVNPGGSGALVGGGVIDFVFVFEEEWSQQMES